MFRMRLVSHSFLILTAAGLITTAYADNRSEFEKWLGNETQSFQEYRDKRDKEFTGFLKKQWKEMQTFQGLVRDKTPKPMAMPVAPKPKPVPKPVIVTKPAPEPDTRPDAFPQPGTQIKPDIKPEIKPTPTPVVPIVKVPEIKPVPQPVKVKPTPVVVTPKGRMVKVNYFGQMIQFSYDPKFKVRVSSRLSESAMSNHWSALSQADYEALLKQLNAQRKPLALNDWGYAVLTHNLAKGIYPGQKNEQALFAWFMLIKAGYEARIAYESSRVFLLLPSQQQLYAAAYFTFDNVRYYALGFEGKKLRPGRVYTYDGHYPGANKRMDMRLNKAINTLRSSKVKDLSFKYRGKSYRIKASYDRQTVDFMRTYPQMDIGMYFAANVNQATANPLLSQLKPLVEGKSEQEAVNLLLRFVQTAFDYKTDEGQFGVENYLFPEETLHYPYSDCEDRSVLFAWLVHNLLGLEVVGLDFPGHIAAAVHFTEKVKGDSIRLNNKRFVVTDPTYVNATAGMTMPNYKNKRPGVIRILF